MLISAEDVAARRHAGPAVADAPPAAEASA
jgi:hypothetical protein